MQKIKSSQPQQYSHSPHQPDHHQPQTQTHPPNHTHKTFLLILTFISYIILTSTAYILQPQHYKIAIIGTNDLHGKVYPTMLQLQLQKQGKKQQYKYGGLTYMASMIQTIRQQYNGNVLYLDAGDQFQGGIQASKLISSGQIMNDYFNIVGLSGSSIGNHQFDFGKEFLDQYLEGRSMPNLAANLRSETGQINFLPNQKSSMLYTLPNSIKIGVIGLSTIQTLTTTSGFSSKKFPPYKFLPYKQILIQQSNILKSQGANAIILVSHMGNACKSNTTLQLHTDSQIQQKCPIDQLTKLLNQLPQNTIHAVVQGHRHKMAHTYYKNIPYIGSINGGYYFNIIHLQFQKKSSYFSSSDSDSNSVQLISANIQGPIPVCQKIFKNTKKCQYIPKQSIQSAGQLIHWQFHNKTVKQHPQLQSILQQKYTHKMSQYFQPIVTNQLILHRVEDNQSQLSNLFTTLLHQAIPDTDFTLLNTGGFRTQWLPGIIQYQDYFNMFPFDNQIQQFQLSGKQLIQIMKIIQNNRKILQTWNLKMQINIYQKNNTKQLISIKFMNGSQIILDKVYKGVTLSYLLDGGDLFGKAFNLYGWPMNRKKVGEFRSVIRSYLEKMKVIRKGSLIDENNRRLIVYRYQ